MEDLQKGDVLVGDTGSENTVIERLGDIVFTTRYGNDLTVTNIWTIAGLKSNGFIIKQPEPELLNQVTEANQ